VTAGAPVTAGLPRRPRNRPLRRAACAGRPLFGLLAIGGRGRGVPGHACPPACPPGREIRPHSAARVAMAAGGEAIQASDAYAARDILASEPATARQPWVQLRSALPGAGMPRGSACT
jgi:hypothetical protein